MSEPLNRVDQLDGYDYDEDIKRLLFRQLLNTFSQNVINKYQAEIKLLMDYLFFRFSISKDITTPGNQIQNVDFVITSQIQKLLFMFLTVFLPYISEKLSQYMIDNNWSDPQLKNSSNPKDKLKYWLFRLFSLANSFIKILNLIRLILFLWNHKYRDIPQLLLGIQMKRYDEKQERFIYYDYVNRLIVWNSISTALQNILPFFDFSRLRNLFESTHKLTQQFGLDEEDVKSQILCGVCGTTQVCMPYEALPCKHVYCYYCARGKIQEKEDEEEGGEWKCERCQEEVKELQKLNYNN